MAKKQIVRICETDVDGTKKLEYALIQIKGVSFMFAHAVRMALGLPNKPLAEFDEETIKKIEDCIKNPQNYGIPSWLFNRRKDLETGKDMHLVSGELEFRHKMDIEFLKKIKCYRGIRHALGYKVRGQRTKSHGARPGGRSGLPVGVAKPRVSKKK